MILRREDTIRNLKDEIKGLEAKNENQGSTIKNVFDENIVLKGRIDELETALVNIAVELGREMLR